MHPAKHWKDVIPTQLQRPESPTVNLTWHVSKYKVRKFHQRKRKKTAKLAEHFNYTQEEGKSSNRLIWQY